MLKQRLQLLGQRHAFCMIEFVSHHGGHCSPICFILMVQTLFCTETATKGTAEFCVADTQHCANKHRLKVMLVFPDCEFTDFIDCELISLAMVSEDGQHEIYLEVSDFDLKKCNAFVQSAVCSQLGQRPEALVCGSEVDERLRSWFATLPDGATVASDSQHDRDLLADALDGDWPENVTGWLDLRPLTETQVFNVALTRYHSLDKPWHYALHDASANRAGWLALQQLPTSSALLNQSASP